MGIVKPFSFLTSGVVPSPPPAASIPSGFVYGIDPNDYAGGSTWTADSGGSNTNTTNLFGSYSNASPGLSLYDDGITTSYGSRTLGLSSNAVGTWFVWFKLDTLQDAALYSSGYSAYTQGGFRYLDNPNMFYDSLSGRLVFRWQKVLNSYGSVGTYSVSSTADISTDTWYLATFNRNGSSQTWYQNNVAAGTGTQSSTFASLGSYTTYTGKNWRFSTPQLDGIIGHTYYYGTSLGTSDMTDFYDATKATYGY